MDFTHSLSAAIQALHSAIAHAPDPGHKTQLAGALRTALAVQQDVYGPGGGARGAVMSAIGGQPMMAGQMGGQ